VTGMLLTEATNRRPGSRVGRQESGVAIAKHAGRGQSSGKPWGGVR
jgi:hypothetical protein